MNKKVLLPLILSAFIGAAKAATVTVTVVDDGVSNIGAAGTFYRALTNANAGDTITFNIPGAGPHYLKPPPGGFPLIYQKHNLTIDGYTQPGSAVNTAAITATNNAVIKIVLDLTSGNYTDMAYVYFGSLTTSVPPINNAVLYGDGSGGATGRERGGYDPSSTSPYTPGEVAGLGIYRSTNVTVKGLALIGNGSGYLMAVAQDFGFDSAIKERFTYDGGTCRGLHIAGCWFGIDPADKSDKGAEAALTMFRHRDRGGLTPATRRPLAATDPDDEGVPNGENATIGVKAGSANPRAEFNVIGKTFEISIGAELARTRVSGNQIMSATDIGRYSDTAVPSMLFGTDGDGVNDADEGNLFLGGLGLYNNRSKVYVVAGNTFNLERDGSRPGITFGYAIDTAGFDQGSILRFGSDMNGVSDALEGNRVYDAGFGFNVSGSAPVNGSWFTFRRNLMVNCISPLVATPYFDKFMDASSNPRPTVSASSTVSLLTGTCATNKPPYSKIFIDLYLSDPEADAQNDPAGKYYLTTFEDNGAGDGNPAIGAFSFNISSLGLTAGTNVTVSAVYVNDAKPSIANLSYTGTNVSFTITNGSPTFNIQRASVITGPWSTISLAKVPGNVTVPLGGGTAFYRLGALSFAAQTSQFSFSTPLLP